MTGTRTPAALRHRSPTSSRRGTFIGGTAELTARYDSPAPNGGELTWCGFSARCSRFPVRTSPTAYLRFGWPRPVRACLSELATAPRFACAGGWVDDLVGALGR